MINFTTPLTVFKTILPCILNHLIGLFIINQTSILDKSRNLI